MIGVTFKEHTELAKQIPLFGFDLWECLDVFYGLAYIGGAFVCLRA